SAEKPDRIRGPNLSGAWCDELCTWRYPQTWTEGLIPALRIGEPRVVVTTTPRTTALIRELASPEAITELRRRYEGTRLGRQELLGELIEDIEGALWNRSMLEHRARWAKGHPGC